MQQQETIIRFLTKEGIKMLMYDNLLDGDIFSKRGVVVFRNNNDKPRFLLYPKQFGGGTTWGTSNQGLRDFVFLNAQEALKVIKNTLTISEDEILSDIEFYLYYPEQGVHK